MLPLGEKGSFTWKNLDVYSVAKIIEGETQAIVKPPESSVKGKTVESLQAYGSNH